MKKLTAIIFAAIMMMSLAACTGGNRASEQATTDPLTKDDVISVNVPSHVSWPYQDDWKAWQYIEEACGATLDVTAIPASDANTKYPLMFTSPETLPDVMAFTTKLRADQYSSQGALIALDDMTQYMPNYNAWVESLSDDEYQNNIVVRKGGDGKIYYAPVMGREQSINVRAWLYRKDIFEKHNLEVPTTYDELYNVSKKLKQIYPNSFPFCVRSGLSSINTAGASWKPYFYTGVYYDYETEKWSYGAAEEIMVEVVEFYKKMLAEKLMPSDFMTIDTSSWQELVTTDRGFIMPEYQTRIDFFNSIARENNPDFDLHAMIPPVAKADTGKALVARYNIDPTGMVMCNTRDEKRIANAAKFLDWFYSDEAVELVSWGKEGETFEVVDGKKQYISDENNTQPNVLYGFGTYGTALRTEPESVLALESADIAETRDMVLEHTEKYANPMLNLAFNEEEQKIIDTYYNAINTYAEEQISKFILGQKPISEFDAYLESFDEMGLPELLSAYESAYNRIK